MSQFRSDIEELFLTLGQEEGVQGVMLISRKKAIPLKTTIEDTYSQSQYAHIVSTLVNKARFLVQELQDLEKDKPDDKKPAKKPVMEPVSSLSFLRIRTREHELMVSPDEEHILLVIQKVRESTKESM